MKTGVAELLAPVAVPFDCRGRCAKTGAARTNEAANARKRLAFIDPSLWFDCLEERYSRWTADERVKIRDSGLPRGM